MSNRPLHATMTLATMLAIAGCNQPEPEATATIPVVMASVHDAALAFSGAQQPYGEEELIEAAREIMHASRYAALVTLTESGTPRARTMDPFPPDSQFVIWMGTSRATRKVQELRRDNRVLVYYQDPRGAGYVSIEGLARLVDDDVEKERRWKEEWARFYPDRARTYLLIAVTPIRLEVVNYSRGLMGDSVTWRVPAMEFDQQQRSG